MILSAEEKYATPGFIRATKPDGAVIEMRSRATRELSNAIHQIRAERVPVACDPVTYFSQEQLVDRRYVRYQGLPWGSSSLTPAGTARIAAARTHLCSEVVKHTVSVLEPPDIIVAPYFMAGSADELPWLDESMECGREMLRLVSVKGCAQKVWSGAAISHTLLMGDYSKVRAILETCPTPVIYLLVRTTQPTAGPLGRADVLEAMRNLTAALAKKGIAVMGARRFSSGLALGSHGAAGWAVGASSLLQNFTARSRRGGGGQPRRDWLYVPELLNSLTFPTRAALVTSKLAPQLAASTIYGRKVFPPSGPPPSHATAAQRADLYRHNMLVMREQARSLGAGGTAAMLPRLRTAIAAAISLYQGVPGLGAGEDGSFLQAWQAVI
jgi:hypothetical protein